MKTPTPPTSHIDHETGLIHLPGKEPMPLVGPTAGAEYEQLKTREKEHAAFMLMLKRTMLSTYQCTQCRQTMPGAQCRIKWLTLDGVTAEVLVCRNQRCDAPVVMTEDARDLRKPPGGRI